ncbi:MAG: hypothetical protein R2715_16845 [Ilumatobacteraceae bacterium]
MSTGSIELAQRPPLGASRHALPTADVQRLPLPAQHHREDLCLAAQATHRRDREVLAARQVRDPTCVRPTDQGLKIDEHHHFGHTGRLGAGRAEHEVGQGVGQRLLLGEQGVGVQQLTGAVAHSRPHSLAGLRVPLSEQRGHAVTGTQGEPSGPVGSLLLGPLLAVVPAELTCMPTHRSGELLRSLGSHVGEQHRMTCSHRRPLLVVEVTSRLFVGGEVIQPERTRLQRRPQIRV